MYCPQCGQQQASGQLRFCSRCGFPLEGVLQLLGNNGLIPTTYVDKKGRNLTPRQLGLRHGAMLMLSTFLVVPIVSILAVNVMGHAKIFIPLAAMVCFIGGLLRIIYALLFEEDVPRVKPHPSTLPSYVPPAQAPLPLATEARTAALPPHQGTPVGGWRQPQRVDTAELVTPRSVTENTTRLLDENIDPNAH